MKTFIKPKALQELADRYGWDMPEVEGLDTPKEKDPFVKPVMPSQIYSDAELCQWFEWAARYQSDPYWYDKIMEVRIVLGAGLRIAEVLRLHSDDITPEGLITIWKSKTRRQRSVKTSPELLPFLRQFSLKMENRPLFGEITTTRTLQLWWDECMEAAGIPKHQKRGCHSGRHTYASFELASGRLNIAELQAQLGHVSVTMTLQKYCHSVTLFMYSEDKTPKFWAVALPAQKLRVAEKAS
jgi:integrase